ncbi:MAG TPA: PIN domain-containing protein [Planctomycetota bacterium]|nr:PIN domain-containing protein [Planctomycetota bacterium]
MTEIEGPILLDTTVLVLLARGKEAARRVDERYRLRTRPEKPFLSIVTLGEMLAFARSRRWGDEKSRRLVEIAQELVVVDIRHKPILEGFAEVKTIAREQGRGIGDNDLWIAATARAIGACLLTTDRDFDFLDGKFLRREWIDPRGLAGPTRVSEPLSAYQQDPLPGEGGGSTGST